MISSNGTDWLPAAVPVYQYGIDSLAFGGGLFVGVGRTMAVSSNGTIWTTLNTQMYELASVAYGNGTFLAVGRLGTLLTSMDGRTWTDRRGTAADCSMYNVSFGGGRFVAVGNGPRSPFDPADGDTVLVSSNGIQWTRYYVSGFSGLRDVAFGRLEDQTGLGYNLFVALRGLQTIATSPDGALWETEGSNTTFDLFAITFGAGRFVATGTGVASSTDGRRFVGHLPAFKQQNDVAFGNGRFLSVGEEGIAYTSTDGVHWYPANYGDFTISMKSVTYGRGLFVAAGTQGSIRVTATGAAWTARNSGTNTKFVSVAFGNGTFLALAADGSLAVSEDTVTWTLYPKVAGELYGLGYGNGTFVAVGFGGRIVQSGNLHVPRFEIGSRLSAEGFRAIINGEIEREYHLQRSGNFIEWVNVATFMSTQSTTIILDSAATNSPRFFYRLLRE